MADRVLNWQERPVNGISEIRFELVVGTEAVPALFYVPEGADPAPLVIIQHPATSSKDDYFVRDVALQWASRGWICGGLDAPLHGDRADHDPMSILRDRDRFTEVARQFAGELTAVVNALADMYPVDLGRLGYVGYSMGSMLGIPAVAADGRFKAAAFCLIGEGGLLGAANEAHSPVRELGSVAVRIVGKTRDEFFSKEATEALYEALPGEKHLAWWPGGHFEIGPEVIKSAGDWLKAKL
jgi:dienelactone hydrolase